MTSRGLMQVMPGSADHFDPLANMTAAVEYARSMVDASPWISRAEYDGVWAADIMTRPRRGGKTTAIMKAMDEIRAEGGTVHYADGGVISGPPGGVEARLSPGEFVLTPETSRRWGWPPMTTAEVEAELDVVDEPLDDYPEPPQLPVW